MQLISTTDMTAPDKRSRKWLFIVVSAILVLQWIQLVKSQVSSDTDDTTTDVSDKTQALEPHGRLASLIYSIAKAPKQGFGFLTQLVRSIPFSRILLASGALISLFFIFVRILVVLGPILLLGIMTRESTDAVDFLKMLIEFYNQIVEAIDDQAVNQ